MGRGLDEAAVRSSHGLVRILGPFRLLAHNPTFTLLFSGQVVSSLGSWLYSVALVVVAYQVTHSATTVATLTFVRLLPLAAFMPFTGALADKFDRKTLMISSDVGRAVCMFGLAFATTRATFWLAFPLVFINTSLASMFRPALNGLLPAAVAKEDLHEANSLMSQMDSVAMILGPTLGGLLVLAGAPQFAFIINGATFIASATTLLFLKLPDVPRSGKTEEGGWLAELLAGFRFIFRENEGVLAAYTLSEAGMALIGGAYWTIVLLLSIKAFHLGGQGMGFLNAAYGAGGVLGGFVIGLIGKRLAMGRVYIFATCVAGGSIILLGLSPAGVLPFLFIGLAGIADVVVEVMGTTAIQFATPAELLGRVFGAFESVILTAMLVGSIVAGPLVLAFGARAATVALGAAGLVVLAICIPWLLRIESVLGVRIFLRQVPALASLSRRLLDEVAAQTQSEHFAPAAVIVRQGDEGEKLYIVRSGEADVIAEDPSGAASKAVSVATIGKMDYFGEIALLRGGRRTATVKARNEVETYTLGREAFQALLRGSTEFEQTILGTSDARFIDTQNQLLLRR
jgi:MFS family permease